MNRPFTHVMHNRLRIVCVEMPHLHAAELAIYLKVGGRDDPSGKEGLSHFLEHILFRGTAEFSSSLEIENAFEAIGGAPNAATDAESTCYYSRIHPDYFKRGMQIFSSMLMRPLMSGIDIEKRIIAEEAREDLNEAGDEINPDTIVSRLLWPRHPLGMPTIGTLASIESIQRNDLQEHLQRFYTPANAVVVVSGPVRSHEVFAAAEDVFASWSEGAVPTNVPFTTRKSRSNICCVHDSDSQMSLQLAFLGFRRGDPRSTTVRLIRRLLAGGGSSRLYIRLREELGIIYSVEAAIGSYEETGCLAIDLATAPETLTQAIEVTLEELVRICRHQVPADELQRVIRSYCFDLEYSRDSTYEMGGRYGWGELMSFVRSIEDDQNEAESTASAEVQSVARSLFDPDNLRLVAVGPWKKGMKKRVRELVKGFAAAMEG